MRKYRIDSKTICQGKKFGAWDGVYGRGGGGIWTTSALLPPAEAREGGPGGRGLGSLRWGTAVG